MTTTTKDDRVGEEAGDSICLLPPVRPVVYLRPGQIEATVEQEMAAIVEAYTQAARRGEVGIIRSLEAEEKDAASVPYNPC